MKNRSLLIFLFSILSIALKAQQVQDTLKPYLRYTSLPAFNIMETDSSTIFNTYNIPTGKITAIVFFDPDCKHCKHTVKNLIAGMDSVKDIQFYFVTSNHSMQSIRAFYDEFHFADHKNIVLTGRDYEFFGPTYYKIMSVPDVVVYDKKKKLVKLVDREFTATDLYNLVHGN